MSVCCECCVLAGRGLCVELITGPEESSVVRRCVWYRNLMIEETLTHWGDVAPKTNPKSYVRYSRCSNVSTYCLDLWYVKPVLQLLLLNAVFSAYPFALWDTYVDTKTKQ
jgi:hypothetical protein